MLRLFASLWNSTVSPRKSVRKSPRRNQLRLEGLEPRLMFASGQYFDEDYSTVVASGSGSVQMVSSASTGSLQALSEAVNTSDIDRAIEAGLGHLQNILDANNHGIPFFFVWANGSPPHMAFERHLTSNAAGRATYALLMGAEAIGAELNPHVMDTLKEWVLTSLHKPRNGNWNDHSPGNQMVTGLASDPRYYGSEQFDLTFLFNMGAGMRGALGLATLADDANEIQPGYLWSSRTVFEVAVHNIRQFYVYGGGEIGGERAYNWETFRHQLGLEGGDGWTGNINSEIKRDWSNIWTSWSNPFLIRELVKYHEATGHQGSLDLATELRDHAFYQAFPLSVSQSRINNFTHMFEVTAEMNAYSRLALVLGDADMMDRVRVRYEALRGVGFNSTGWVPEWLNHHSDVGEVNNTAELIETALNFAEWGWTDYYQDVERFTRGHVLPSQLLDTSFVVSNSRPANDSQRNIPQRIHGAFGFPAPYGYVATRNPTQQTGGYHVDVTAGAVATLAVIKDAIHRLHNGVHEINLLFDLDNSQVNISSPYPEGDRLTITTKVAGDVRLRLPSWADRAAVTASLTQQGLEHEISSNQVLIRQPQVGTSFYVAMPLATVRTTDVVNGRSITIDWRGDSVIAMSRMNTPLPFFATPSSSPPPPNPPPSPDPNSPTNAPPVVSAGPDHTVMLGATVSLIGTATDDGLPESPGNLSLGWSKLTGPGAVIFADADALSTTVQLSVPGQYVLRLSASDGQFSRSDDVTITVVDPVQPVTVAFQDGVFPTIEYAGTRDTTINSSAPVSGHGAENKLIVDGHPDLAALMAWDVSTIPIGSIIISASIELFVTNTSKHSYELYALQQAWEELAATWQQFAPGQSWAIHGASGAADSGTEILGQIALPKHGFRQIGLNQAGLELIQAWIDDPEGNHGVILKDYVSADDDAHFSSRETPTASQRPKLVITYRPGEGSGGSGPGENEPEEPPPPLPVNQPPQVDAGLDQTIQLPASVSLAGTVTDDGLPASPGMLGTAWSAVSGPGSVTFADAGNRNTTASFSAPGTYILRLAANDGQHQSFDELTVTVLPATNNQPPQVEAGVNQTIQFPATASLAGTVNDDDLPASPGNVASTWSKVSGPGTVIFGNTGTRNTTASFSAAGTYVLRLMASDGEHQTFDDLTVTVLSAVVNQAPQVNAGLDQTIQLPATASLAGTVTDDGLPASLGNVASAWSKVSGPGTVTFGNASARNTSVSFSAAGTYVLRLSANDGQYQSFDELTVTVIPPLVHHQPPIVSAGPDIEVTFGKSLTLPGAVTFTSPARPITAIWTLTLGPGPVYYSSPNSLITDVYFERTGTYILRLTISDGHFTVFDEVTVTAVPKSTKRR